MSSDAKALKVATWNIAAINNNPFEYWITHEDPAYNELMQAFQGMIDDPSEVDCKMSSVFTQAMLASLQERMQEAKMPGVQEAVKIWEDEYMGRTIINGFLKDKTVGSKRLTSMPDRVTNTILTSDAKNATVCRPSIINCYEEDMGSMETWWNAWQEFMFDTEVLLRGKGESEPSLKKVYSLLLPIKRSKYPAVTEEEEKHSLALQTIALAAFDAVTLHVMNLAKPPQVWQKIKLDLCNALVKNKSARTVEVLEGVYKNADIIFLQEVAILFCDQLRASSIIAERFHVLAPNTPDRRRNQNSVILASKAKFAADALVADEKCFEVTEAITSLFPSNTKVPIATGDLFAITATDKNDQKYVLASFHGDTNGLASLPVLQAVHDYASKLEGHKLIFGLDANTHETEKKGKNQGFASFVEAYTGLGMSSCWGVNPSAQTYTTFNARTYIQPQLNKAVKMEDRATKGDRNPKDFILFYSTDYSASDTTRDNTGSNPPVYDNDMVFPTLSFPSDHGVVATTLA